MWNELVNQAVALANVGKLLADFLTDSHVRSQILEKFSDITWKDIAKGLLPNLSDIPDDSNIHLKMYKAGENTTKIALFIVEVAETITGIGALFKVLKTVKNIASAKLAKTFLALGDGNFVARKEVVGGFTRYMICATASIGGVGILSPTLLPAQPSIQFEQIQNGIIVYSEETEPAPTYCGCNSTTNIALSGSVFVWESLWALPPSSSTCGRALRLESIDGVDGKITRLVVKRNTLTDVTPLPNKKLTYNSLDDTDLTVKFDELAEELNNGTSQALTRENFDNEYGLLVDEDGLTHAVPKRLANVVQAFPDINSSVAQKLSDRFPDNLDEVIGLTNNTDIVTELDNLFNATPIPNPTDGITNLRDKFLDDLAETAGQSGKIGGDVVNLTGGKVRAWEVIYGDGSVLYRTYRSNIDNLTKVDDYLSYNPNKIDELKEAFNTAPNKDEFIGSFIGGPLRKNELEELNNLYYRQASTYDDGAGGTITATETNRIEELESQLGSYEHPNTLTTNSSQIIGNSSIAPQTFPDNFWADVKVADGKIEGLIPDKRYDYVITYPFDNSQPEFRLGLGHYRISGEATAVKGAGSLRFNAEGKIYYINRQSGHYISIPESNLPSELDETVNILNSNSLISPNIDIDYSL